MAECIDLSAISLLAVHISDGVLSNAGCGIFAMIAAVLIAVAIRGLQDDDIPRLGLLTAALFVATQIHVPVGVGRVHLILNALAGIILGSQAAIAIGIAVLLQALLFAHGGLSTWGVNTVTMTIPALLGGFAFRRLQLRWPRRSAVFGSLVGLFVCLTTVVMSTTLLLFLGEIPWQATLPFLGLSLPLVIVEALLTGSIVAYLHRVKPEWLRHASGVTSASGTSH